MNFFHRIQIFWMLTGERVTASPLSYWDGLVSIHMYFDHIFMWRIQNICSKKPYVSALETEMSSAKMASKIAKDKKSKKRKSMWWLCVYIYVCMYIYIYTCTQMCICVCIYVHIYTHTYIHIHTDIYIFI